MNKLVKVAAAAFCAVSFTAVAADEAAKDAPEKELQEEESSILEAGFDFDFLSAYVWRNSIQNDDLVMQPCVWADLTVADPLYLGFYVWQNYDLTDHRREVLSNGFTETDYNVHLGSSVWSSEDEDCDLSLELGHEWFQNIGIKREARNEFADTREIYLKATFENPILNVYGQVSWMYEDFGSCKQGVHYELGVNKEIELCDSVTLGGDWNLNFGDAHYLNYLYGTESYGFGGTTVKAYLRWAVTEWMSLGATIAYTGILNGAIRKEVGSWGDDGAYDGYSYARDRVWGGLNLKITF